MKFYSKIHYNVCNVLVISMLILSPFHAVIIWKKNQLYYFILHVSHDLKEDIISVCFRIIWMISGESRKKRHYEKLNYLRYNVAFNKNSFLLFAFSSHYVNICISILFVQLISIYTKSCMFRVCIKSVATCTW